MRVYKRSGYIYIARVRFYDTVTVVRPLNEQIARNKTNTTAIIHFTTEIIYPTTSGQRCPNTPSFRPSFPGISFTKRQQRARVLGRRPSRSVRNSGAFWASLITANLLLLRTRLICPAIWGRPVLNLHIIYVHQPFHIQSRWIFFIGPSSSFFHARNCSYCSRTLIKANKYRYFTIASRTSRLVNYLRQRACMYKYIYSSLDSFQISCRYEGINNAPSFPSRTRFIFDRSRELYGGGRGETLITLAFVIRTS